MVQARSNLGKVMSSYFSFQARSNLWQSIVDLQKILLYNSYFFWFAKFFQYCFYFLNIEGKFVFILLRFKSLGVLGGVGFLHLHSSQSFNSPCLAILIFAVFPNSFNFCFFWIITGSFVLISKSLVFIGDFGFLHPQFSFWSKSPLSLCNPPFDVDGYPPFLTLSIFFFFASVIFSMLCGVHSHCRHINRTNSNSFYMFWRKSILFRNTHAVRCPIYSKVFITEKSGLDVCIKHFCSCSCKLYGKL